MTYITLRNDIKAAFETDFLNPANTLFESGAIAKPEDKQTKNQQRNEILKQGRANFDEESNGLSGAQKVDLYGFHYFQMHVTSSYVCFLNQNELLQEIINESELYFIDIGCGPMTSGVAFNGWLKNCANTHEEVNYIGIDISSNMVNKSKQIIDADNFDFKFKNTLIDNDKSKIISYIKKVRNPELKQSFIINYSFLFASESLNVQEFVDFTNELYESTKDEDNNYAKFVVFYQNPTLASLSTKWEDYKEAINIPNTIPNSSSTFRYQFDDVMGSSNYDKPNLAARFDIIKSY